MRRILLAAAVLGLVSSAPAANVYLKTYETGVELDGALHHVYRLHISLDAGEDWLACFGSLYLYPGTMFHAPPPLGGHVAPDPADFPQDPNLPYDSFVTGPEGWPNVMAGGGVSVTEGPTYGPVFDERHMTLTWFDLVNHYGPADYVLGQWTITQDAVGTFSGEYGLAGVPDIYPFEFTIPEPGTFVLLLVGCAALRNVSRR